MQAKMTSIGKIFLMVYSDLYIALRQVKQKPSGEFPEGIIVIIS